MNLIERVDEIAHRTAGWCCRPGKCLPHHAAVTLAAHTTALAVAHELLRDGLDAIVGGLDYGGIIFEWNEPGITYGGFPGVITISVDPNGSTEISTVLDYSQEIPAVGSR